MSVAIALHLLATVIWVGGMFFAHVALRPALEALQPPPQRLPLMHAVLGRFFRWVWGAVVVLLLSGYWILHGPFGGQAGLHVHLMQAIGWVMFGLFAFLYFMPYRAFAAALAGGDLAVAGVRLGLIRRIILTNLGLGLIQVVLGSAGRYL